MQAVSSTLAMIFMLAIANEEPAAGRHVLRAAVADRRLCSKRFTIGSALPTKQTFLCLYQPTPGDVTYKCICLKGRSHDALCPHVPEAAAEVEPRGTLLSKARTFP